MQGWIKLHRKIWEWPHAKDPEYLSVWLYLITNATHKSYDAIFNGQRITLHKGQLITGRVSISSATSVSSSKVQRILKKLEIEQQIEQQTGNKNRLISILNWDVYQCDEQQSEQQLNNNRTTTEQQLNTNKNVNNIKNDNNTTTAGDASLSDDARSCSLDEFYQKNDREVFKKLCVDIGIKKKMHPEKALSEFEAFDQYFTSTALKDSIKFKKDWKRAFQNWASNALKRSTAENTQIKHKNNKQIADHILGIAINNFSIAKLIDAKSTQIQSNVVFLSLLNKGYTKKEIGEALNELQKAPPKGEIYSWGILYQYFS